MLAKAILTLPLALGDFKCSTNGGFWTVCASAANGGLEPRVTNAAQCVNVGFQNYSLVLACYEPRFIG
jgi:hypothetical protein